MKIFYCILLSFMASSTKLAAQYAFEKNDINIDEGSLAHAIIKYNGVAPAGIATIKVNRSTSKAGGSDFIWTNDINLNFAGAPTEQIIGIQTVEDKNLEEDETIVLELYNAGAVLLDVCTITIVEKDYSLDFFRAAIGGNVNFAEKNLQVNSVYVDLSFRPYFNFNKWGHSFQIFAPIRAFYNNGSGPQDSFDQAGIRTITIDTNLVVNGIKKVRYWANDPVLSYTTEKRNLALNIPILFAWKVPTDSRVSLFVGYNFEIASITRRETNFKYVDNNQEIDTVASIKQVPIPTPIVVQSPDPTQPPREIQRATIYYQDSKYVPVISQVNPPINYFQLFQGVAAGTTYASSSFNCTLRYILGWTSAFYDRGLRNRPIAYDPSYRHNVQLIFLEKKVGIQLLFDVRIPTGSKGYLNGAPTYYVSFAKTLNFSGLKELFFPK